MKNNNEKRHITKEECEQICNSPTVLNPESIQRLLEKLHKIHPELKVKE